ncbi:MAG: EamA family transporter RarD [Alphaproteobacteria bacterium]|nr:EamA family transporter RarD [Alphaproteobacteria bacterium]
MSITHRQAGIYATAANLIWGFFPVYFHQFTGVSALEVLAHRALWSLLFVALAVALMGKLADGLALVKDARRLRWFLASGLLIAVNWGGFIWAATNGQILQSGLGYYIFPLVSVALGAVLLKERPSTRQWLAIGLAAIGVGVLILALGQVPWISLVLALSFALYGLVRKQAPAESLLGLLAETLLLAPLALGYILWLQISGQAAFLHQSLGLDALLLLGGVVTAIPLMLFARAARKLTLTTLGLLFYVNPTLQFVIAVFLYDELFTKAHGLAFAFIWTALALYSWGAWNTKRQKE